MARLQGLAHVVSPGGVVVFSPADDACSHGNFYPAAWRAIQTEPLWRRRLLKAHTAGKRVLRGADGRPAERAWCELDSSTSSDALLMNVFCTPAVLRSPGVCSLLGIGSGLLPMFGVRARVPLHGGRQDSTELDMLVGDLLVEAKLTESNFQLKELRYLERYRDFAEVFDVDLLTVRDGVCASYQLCRNVLAAVARGGRFCVIVDARRRDLVEQVHAVQRAVRDYELRTRIGLLTWQEIARELPAGLRAWLGEKYGFGQEEQIPPIALRPAE